MKPRVIAAVRKHPFHAVYASARDAVRLIGDFMYGTPERTQYTVAFAMMLALLGTIMGIYQDSLLPVCAVN